MFTTEQFGMSSIAVQMRAKWFWYARMHVMSLFIFMFIWFLAPSITQGFFHFSETMGLGYEMTTGSVFFVLAIGITALFTVLLAGRTFERASFTLPATNRTVHWSNVGLLLVTDWLLALTVIVFVASVPMTASFQSSDSIVIWVVPSIGETVALFVRYGLLLMLVSAALYTFVSFIQWNRLVVIALAVSLVVLESIGIHLVQRFGEALNAIPFTGPLGTFAGWTIVLVVILFVWSDRLRMNREVQ